MFKSKIVLKIKVLIEKSGIKIDCIAEYTLGGITYEMLLIFDGGKKILIDLNGKEVNGDYEDYLYDSYRCKIAQKYGFQYYRLLKAWEHFYTSVST